MMLFIKDPSSILKWQHYTGTVVNSVFNPAFWVLSSSDPAFYALLDKKCAATSPSGHGKQWTEPCPPNRHFVSPLLLHSSQRKVLVVLSQQEKIMWRKPGRLLVHRGDKPFHKLLQPFNTGILSNSGLAQECWREVLSCLKGGKGAWWEPCCTSQIQHLQISPPAPETGTESPSLCMGELAFVSLFSQLLSWVITTPEKPSRLSNCTSKPPGCCSPSASRKKLPVRTTFL